MLTSLDVETCSILDLKKVGVAAYAEHPSTRVICGSYLMEGNSNPSRWNYKAGPPWELLNFVDDGGTISAWNAIFEWYMWNVVLRRQHPTIVIPELKLEKIVDTMAVAANNGLPLGLDMAAQALPHLGISKDKEGRALMLRMSRPRALSSAGGAAVWWHEADPAKLRRLQDYCDQDVLVENRILNDLTPMSVNERRVWLMDAKVGSRGMQYDDVLGASLQRIAKKSTARLDDRMKTATSGQVKSTRDVKGLLAYVQKNLDPMITSLAKDKLADTLEKVSLGDYADHSGAGEALRLRQEAAKSSVAKLAAMEAYAGGGGRMRFLTQYFGAFRTGRWAGRGPQLQNYPRSAVKDQEALVNYFLSPGCDLDGFEMLFGVSPLLATSSALRGCITVPSGTAFAALDFKQIEARVLPWLAGDLRKLSVFEKGGDIYVTAAAGMFLVPEEEVSDDERQMGKVSELALGFGGGVGAFQSMAANYGLKIPDEKAEALKDAWRVANKKIVNFWYALIDAALLAVNGLPGTLYTAGDFISFERQAGSENHLHMILPSGRRMVYRDVMIGTNRFGRECVSYMGVNQYTRKWEREDTYGGKLAENATQAVARDVMASAMLRLHEMGLPIIGSVHDEVLMELGPEIAFADIRKKFEEVPVWAPGLPIASDGYVGSRFRK